MADQDPNEVLEPDGTPGEDELAEDELGPESETDELEAPVGATPAGAAAGAAAGGRRAVPSARRGVLGRGSGRIDAATRAGTSIRAGEHVHIQDRSSAIYALLAALSIVVVLAYSLTFAQGGLLNPAPTLNPVLPSASVSVSASPSASASASESSSASASSSASGSAASPSASGSASASPSASGS